MLIRPIGPSIHLLAVLILSIGCYWPGLQGGFLFDDIPNLKGLGTYGGVTDWESFKGFVLAGWSGPTGRPLSLMSFLLNDNTWPSQAAWFKPTNLAVHLLCGLLLAWATLLLLRNYGHDEPTAQWLAVFSASCWLLHPFLVSTTLYVVQRMAQLAALFVFAGIAGYLHGRSLLPRRPRAAYLWMGGSLTLGTLLALLSKENGILLPILVGVIEFCAPRRDQLIRPTLVFRALFIWLPALAVFGYLATNINFSPNPWPTRNFNQIERLLTEPRIIWDYLGNLFLPHIEGQGLYRDDLAISLDLFTPSSTLPALLGLVALLTAALIWRRRFPLFSLGVLFFLVGHLLESTLLGLEPYFEHRNYLPAAFLFLPIASALQILGQHTRKAIPVGFGLLILTLLAFFTWNRAQLWSHTEKLELYWATTATHSPRAQNAVASFYMRHRLYDDAQRKLEEANVRLPHSGLLTMSRLLQKVRIRQATPEDFNLAAERLAHQTCDAQVVMALRTLVETIVNPDYPSLYRTASLRLLNKLDEEAAYQQLSLFVNFAPYLKGWLYLAEGSPEQAVVQFSKSIAGYNDIEAALQMVALMANAGHLQHSLRLLDQAETMYRQQSGRTLKRSRTFYDQELARLRILLNNAPATP
jgi:tetratricopeptide (TPR) repeat protein